jgi:hypothetical protein
MLPYSGSIAEIKVSEVSAPGIVGQVFKNRKPGYGIIELNVRCRLKGNAKSVFQIYITCIRVITPFKEREMRKS